MAIKKHKPGNKGQRGGRQPGAGRPSHVPTDALRKRVKQHAALGVTQNELSRILGIDKHTLEKHYRQELDVAMIELNTAVAGKLASAATSKSHTGPTVTAAMFWARTRMGWKETLVQQHTGIDGGPIKSEATVTHAADDSFGAVVAALDLAGRAKAGGGGKTG
jgi:hypothetical protein